MGLWERLPLGPGERDSNADIGLKPGVEKVVVKEAIKRGETLRAEGALQVKLSKRSQQYVSLLVFSSLGSLDLVLNSFLSSQMCLGNPNDCWNGKLTPRSSTILLRHTRGKVTRGSMMQILAL